MKKEKKLFVRFQIQTTIEFNNNNQWMVVCIRHLSSSIKIILRKKKSVKGCGASTILNTKAKNSFFKWKNQHKNCVFLKQCWFNMKRKWERKLDLTRKAGSYKITWYPSAYWFDKWQKLNAIYLATGILYLIWMRSVRLFYFFHYEKWLQKIWRTSANLENRQNHNI